MSKYPCDNWSWSSRRCDPKLRNRHNDNKENRDPISPLSRLAERVDDSRRWAPIPDRWHNHCEWLVNHHRNLRKRFRRTTANDHLSGVLTTLKCTRERRRGSDEDEPVIGGGTKCKRIRSEVEYSELQPTSTWFGSVHPELFQQKLLTPPKVQPFSEEDDEMEVETQKSAPESKADNMDRPTNPNQSSGSGESIAERAKSSTATANRSVSRSPSPGDGDFEPVNFRTSTPTTNEKSRRDAGEPCATFRRSSAWKDYVMSHDPILFRSYVDTKYPKKSWRHSHQKLAARHGRKYRRSSSGRIRKPPTPKSLRISWNSLDDVVQNEGILRSPLQLPPILPRDVTPPMNTVNDHGGDFERDDELSVNNSHADVDLGEVIHDGIRAIRKDCTARYQSVNDSYAASDERDGEDSIDPSQLSDISLGEEGESSMESTDKHGYDLDEVSSDEDIDDICRIVDKELNHDDYNPDDILTEISFDILDDLEVDSKYPPNYFRAGFADRAVRRRKMKKATSMINNLDPQARSFKPRYTPVKDNADQRIVKFADRETPDEIQGKEIMKDDGCDGGTKFYPSDVRFSGNNKDGLMKVRTTITKASEHRKAESKAVIPVSVPETVKQVDMKHIQQKDVKDCESIKNIESEVKKENCDGQQQCRKGEACKRVESEQSIPEAEAETCRDAVEEEKKSSIKPIAKGKAKRQVAHKISVVMGRRPWKPSQVIKNPNVDDSGRSVSWSLAAGGDDDNGGVVPKRIPQLRRVEVHQGDASDVGNDGMVPSSNTDAVETVRTGNETTEPKGHMGPARTECNIQPNSLPPESSIRGIDASQPRHSALMKQRLALLKESYGNSPVGVVRSMNLTDRSDQEQSDSQRTAGVGKGVTSKECEYPRVDRLEFGNLGIELPDVNNNRTVNNVPQAKINQRSKIEYEENNKGNSNHASEAKENDLSCKKTHPAKEKEPEPLMNVERAAPLSSEQNEVRRSRATPLTEVRDNHPPQPLMQNPPYRFPHPPHNMNPNVHPNIHPNMHALPGNAPLYHQHPPDQPRPYNPAFSVYHRHQMALRAAAMHYYNQQRHMVLQRHHHPGFFPPHPHPVNMHPGYRPEWNMPGPGPPR